MNIKYFIMSILYISISWGIGVQALNIPRNAGSLGTSNTGIAGNIDPSINPAILSKKNNFLQISMDQWLGYVKGSQAVIQWNNKFTNHLSIRSWNANELELWGDKPENEPLGSFGAHWVSAAYTLSHDFNTAFQYGMQVEGHYSHLFTEYISGVTVNFGLMSQPIQSLNLGVVIRNLGYENTNGLNSSLPLTAGIGSAYTITSIKSTVLADLEYDSTHGIILKSALLINWEWLNLRMGHSFNENNTSTALGFGFQYRKWGVGCSILIHENSALGLPLFIDIRRYI